jgi:hypothetical protein
MGFLVNYGAIESSSLLFLLILFFLTPHGKLVPKQQ